MSGIQWYAVADWAGAKVLLPASAVQRIEDVSEYSVEYGPPKQRQRRDRKPHDPQVLVLVHQTWEDMPAELLHAGLVAYDVYMPMGEVVQRIEAAAAKGLAVCDLRMSAATRREPWRVSDVA